MPVRRRRSGRTQPEKQVTPDGSFFIQLIICAALICSFMLVKDTPLPDGLTPAQHIIGFLNKNMQLDKWAHRFLPDAVIPASGDSISEPESDVSGR